jgi:eukaryotic-like serine/threonine-protein kinase
VEAEPSNSPVQVGDVVAGKYRVERTLGRGGIGIVVAAHHLALDEAVALKFIGLNLAAEREVVQRLLREARATFRLRSKHTVRVLDADELPSGAVYIVMELLDGRDLRTELAERGPLPEEEVVSYVLQACDALEEAHTLGIVHRDLKPHNLFLARQRRGPPVVKVLDFGMSKVDPAMFEGGPLTLPETALGTPRYMAPEQWRSASTVDHRADIWALGVVMYELMTGKVPLQGMPLGERQARLLAGAIPSPSALHPHVSEDTARVIMRCLKADPVSRWRSVAHLATALRDACPTTTPDVERAEVTQTAVTAIVPTLQMREQAARAFAADAPASEPLPEATRRPTLPDTPAAIDEARSAPDSDEATIVRPPIFTPPELVLDSVPSPVVEVKGPVEVEAPPARGELPVTGERKAIREMTLRSAGPLPGVQELLHSQVTDETLRLPGAPLHPSKAPAAVAPPQAVAITPPVPPWPRPAQPARRRRTSLVALALVVALLAVVLGGLAAWMVGR